jgi:hypothetical protein
VRTAFFYLSAQKPKATGPNSNEQQGCERECLATLKCGSLPNRRCKNFLAGGIFSKHKNRTCSPQTFST